MERWFPIETPRLLLREFELRDFADVHEYGSDPLVSRFDLWVPNTEETTRDVLRRRLAAQEQWPRDDVSLAVELPGERKVIGSVSLWIDDSENRTAGFGYAFNRTYWGQGYGTEAARALLTAGFGRLKLHRIWATCDVRNHASRKLMERLGMRREAHYLRDKFQKGEWRDSYLYAILKDEWDRAIA